MLIQPGPTEDKPERTPHVARLALVLFVAFLIMHLVKSHAEHVLERDTSAFASGAPLVEVVTVRSAAANRPLRLPGETAAWYESQRTGLGLRFLIDRARQ